MKYWGLIFNIFLPHFFLITAAVRPTGQQSFNVETLAEVVAVALEHGLLSQIQHESIVDTLEGGLINGEDSERELDRITDSTERDRIRIQFKKDGPNAIELSEVPRSRGQKMEREKLAKDGINEEDEVNAEY